MSEEEATSTWLTVAAAAVALGISERQARRDAGHLTGHDKRHAGHVSGHSVGHKAGHGALVVRLEALRDLRASRLAAGASEAVRAEVVDMAPDVRLDTVRAKPDTRRTSNTPSAEHGGHDAGHVSGHELRVLAASSVEVELLRDALARERDQVAFLRLQVEAANRATAEAHAALRAALKMSERALLAPSGEVELQVLETATPAPQDATQSAAQAERQQEGTKDESAPHNALERRDGASTWERSKGLRGWLLRMLRG